MADISKEEVALLIERARLGDSKAFDRIVDAYQKALLGHLRARLQDVDEAADVAQQVWIDAWRDIQKSPAEGGFDPARGTSFYTYLLARYAEFRVRQSRTRTRKLRAIGSPLPEDESGREAERPDHRELLPDEAAQRAEEAGRLLAVYSEIFRFVFLCGGYPHQQFAFGFSKLIYGTRSARAIEGQPRLLDREHGADPLHALIESFWEAYKRESRIHDAFVLQRFHECLAPVRVRLPLEVGRLMWLDAASCKQFGKILRVVVGETCLGDYYADRRGGYTTAISDWCDKVERRLRRVLGIEEAGSEADMASHMAQEQQKGPVKPQGCNRCKLRHVPPCHEPEKGGQSR